MLLLPSSDREGSRGSKRKKNKKKQKLVETDTFEEETHRGGKQKQELVGGSMARTCKLDSSWPARAISMVVFPEPGGPRRSVILIQEEAEEAYN
jgi:hypothetical protein